MSHVQGARLPKMGQALAAWRVEVVPRHLKSLALLTLKRSSRVQTGPVGFRQRSALLRGKLVFSIGVPPIPSFSVFSCSGDTIDIGPPCLLLLLLITTLSSGPQQSTFFTSAEVSWVEYPLTAPKVRGAVARLMKQKAQWRREREGKRRRLGSPRQPPQHFDVGRLHCVQRVQDSCPCPSDSAGTN